MAVEPEDDVIRLANSSLTRPVVALTGATGYVGGMLIQPLAQIASELRCITRRPESLTDIPTNARAVKGDVIDPASLTEALDGVDVAYYLVHSLNEDSAFEQHESVSAQNFAKAASKAGIRRIIYLGALAQSDSTHTSAHIESRNRVGDILKSTGVPVTEFRASVIIGAGSMPFEAIRALVERLPVMVTPRWVRMKVQPIAAADLVSYLSLALHDRTSTSHIYEIGCEDVTDYASLMHSYAKRRGLRRFMIPVPVITPRLSSLWLKLVTPTHYRIGRRIVDSAAHSSVVRDESARRDFPVQPITVDEAIEDALADENANLDFLDESPEQGKLTEKIRVGNKFVERRRALVPKNGDTTIGLTSNIGGKAGWLWGDWLWRLRGALDRLVGGPGMRRSSSDSAPEVGKTLDFWTVVRIDDERLTLKADMKLPGDAWLDISVRERNGQVFIEQTAAFDPRGVFGISYWFALYPLHALVFAGMLRAMAKRTEHMTR